MESKIALAALGLSTVMSTNGWALSWPSDSIAVLTSPVTNCSSKDHSVSTFGNQIYKFWYDIFSGLSNVRSSVGGEKGGESLVEPSVAPPFHCYQISKPLVRQFVGNDRGCALLVRCRPNPFVIQQSSFSSIEGI